MKGERNMKIHIITVLLLTFFSSSIMAQETKEVKDPYAVEEEMETRDLFNDGKIHLIVRLDDIGFCHGVNEAFEKVANEGVVSAVSVIVNTPWLDEAVEILKEHPEISVGLHTCLNSEWTPYKWGSVLPAKEVPSLVDQWGNFFPSRKLFMDNKPDLNEFEKELRAQLNLAIAKGLNLSYMDHHMSAAVETPAMQEIFEGLAKEYGLAISRWFGETQADSIYSVTPEAKADILVENINKLEKPGTYLLVCHIGTNNPEMAALIDLNPGGLKNMSVHRAAETNALCDPRLKKVIQDKDIEVVGYDVFQKNFLDEMINPN